MSCTQIPQMLAFTLAFSFPCEYVPYIYMYVHICIHIQVCAYSKVLEGKLQSSLSSVYFLKTRTVSYMTIYCLDQIAKINIDTIILINLQSSSVFSSYLYACFKNQKKFFKDLFI